MPFGLVNSPSVFQAFINDVFRDMLGRWAIVYMDNILIYSNTFDSHVLNVRAVLKRLIDHQLYAKMEKCEFHQTLTSFLGYIISADGVAMDEKINSVLNWPTPKITKDLQHFLGFANFCRRFICNFSTIAAPLTSLLRGGKHYLVWSTAASEAFQQLKERFTSAPILHHPDPELEFLVEVDASNTGIGAILSQCQGNSAKLYPCAYYSRKLNSAERNYDVGDRELLAMNAAFAEWRHWLEGANYLSLYSQITEIWNTSGQPNVSTLVKQDGHCSFPDSTLMSLTDQRMEKLMLSQGNLTLQHPKRSPMNRSFPHLLSSLLYNGTS